MFVDTLLRMIGDNPDAYVQTSDKWIEIEDHVLLYYVFPYLPYALMLVVWVFFFIKKGRYKKDPKKFVWKIVLYSIGAFLLGHYVIPWLFVAILGSLAAYSMYGGTI